MNCRSSLLIQRLQAVISYSVQFQGMSWNEKCLQSGGLRGGILRIFPTGVDVGWELTSFGGGRCREGVRRTLLGVWTAQSLGLDGSKSGFGRLKVWVWTAQSRRTDRSDDVYRYALVCRRMACMCIFIRFGGECGCRFRVFGKPGFSSF